MKAKMRKDENQQLKETSADQQKLVAKFQKTRREKRLIAEEIQSLRVKEDQILRWVPRLDRVENGKYVAGAQEISNWGPEIEGVPRFYLPDEDLNETETLARAKLRKLQSKIFEKHQCLKEQAETEAEMGVQLAIQGIALSEDTLGVPLPPQEKKLNVGKTEQKEPVKSRILFEQMMGRGTRKGENFPDKSHFVVFDCFDGTLLEYFRQATSITAEPPQREYKTIVEIIENIWANRDRDYNIRCLVKRLQRVEKEMAGEARDLFATYIPDGDMGKFASSLPRSLREDFTGTMKILRNEGFQDLLVNYPRAKQPFLVGYETEDTVTSEWLVRDSKGVEYKPADYLSEFAVFVRENPEHIEAIRILLDRPQEWNTEALSELRQKLAATPLRFTIENLQKAHEVHYHKALVDIISMVKHAVDNDYPLYTAEERVERAFEEITEGKTFTNDQMEWLERIKAHLKKNLSIDKEDFIVPFRSLPALGVGGGQTAPLTDN